MRLLLIVFIAFLLQINCDTIPEPQDNTEALSKSDESVTELAPEALKSSDDATTTTIAPPTTTITTTNIVPTDANVKQLEVSTGLNNVGAINNLLDNEKRLIADTEVSIAYK